MSQPVSFARYRRITIDGVLNPALVMPSVPVFQAPVASSITAPVKPPVPSSLNAEPSSSTDSAPTLLPQQVPNVPHRRTYRGILPAPGAPSSYAGTSGGYGPVPHFRVDNPNNGRSMHQEDERPYSPGFRFDFLPGDTFLTWHLRYREKRRYVRQGEEKSRSLLESLPDKALGRFENLGPGLPEPQYRFRFGRYAGHTLDEVPSSYLQSLMAGAAEKLVAEDPVLKRELKKRRFRAWRDSRPSRYMFPEPNQRRVSTPLPTLQPAFNIDLTRRMLAQLNGSSSIEEGKGREASSRRDSVMTIAAVLS